MNLADRKLTFARPGDLQTKDLLAVKRIVLDGGEVSPKNVLSRLKESMLIARIYDNTDVIAVAAVKRPASTYVDKIKKQSGYYCLSGEFVELGYISVLPQHGGKGVGKRITAEIVKRISADAPDLKLFATTRKDSVRHILSLNGFHKEGCPWPSTEHPGSHVDLWVLGTSDP